MTGDTPWGGRRLHFVGIGGAGMSAVAIIAHGLGATVTGSDAVDTGYCGALRAHGIEPVIGYDAANVPPDAELVYGSAIADDNPERRAVAAPQLHRADLLAQICALRRCLAVTGTHGKTTTSSMVVQALHGAGLDPSYVVGAQLRATGVNAALGTGEWIVVEADESDRSLLKLDPEIAILTNAELDHHATYESLQDLEATIATFMARADGGAVVWDRPSLRVLCPDGGVPYDAPDAVAGPSGTTFTWDGHAVALAVPGVHNAVNAAGALTACRLAGAAAEPAIAALADFQGARRRMELLGRTPGGAAVYDDYAHHPTEVRAVIAAARALAPRRLIAVFQPHLFSRTRELAVGFGAALAAADEVVVVPIYEARERAEDFPGVDGRMVAVAAADAWPGRRPVAWMPSLAAAEALLAPRLGDGDLCLVMGAGNVDRLAHALVDAGAR
jgi:UDP-N-acetylmuramate--alanine ligase